mgnify:CR=1 FL=1
MVSIVFLVMTVIIITVIMLGRADKRLVPAYLIQAVLNLLVIADILHGNIRHPHNSIDRRADIVAHKKRCTGLSLRIPELE